MPRYPVAIDGGFYEAWSLPFAAQECLNLYPFNPIASATSQGGLYQTHGLVEFKVFGGFPVVAEIMHKGTLYVIAGNTLYSVSSAGLAVALGNVGFLAFTPQMASNGEVLCIQVPTQDGFFYDEVNGFRQITNSVYTAYQSEGDGVLGVASLSGYFLFCSSRTLFHTSSVLDADLGTDFPALAFAAGEARDDDNMRPFSFKGDLILFGTDSYEVWRDVGTEPFAFARISGATQDKGLQTYGGVTQADNTFFFVGSGPNEEVAIWRATDGSPQKISTESIDQVLNQSAGALSYADNSWSYSLSGHTFIGFSANISGGNKTLVYDLTASAIQQRPIWHRQSSPGSTDYTVNAVIKAYGKIMAGCESGLAELRDNVYTEFGEPVLRQFSVPYVEAKGTPMFVSKVELRAETGVGLHEWDQPDSNKLAPVLGEYSDDFTSSWVEMGEEPLGETGENTTLLEWYRLGEISNTRVFRFSIETEAKVALLDLHVTLESGVD